MVTKAKTNMKVVQEATSEERYNKDVKNYTFAAIAFVVVVFVALYFYDPSLFTLFKHLKHVM